MLDGRHSPDTSGLHKTKEARLVATLVRHDRMTATLVRDAMLHRAYIVASLEQERFRRSAGLPAFARAVARH